MTWRTLIVDDEPLARQRMQRLLEDQAGFEVVDCLGSGDELLQWLQQGTADLVLLDIQMPGLTGLETAARLTSDGPLVVFCTAYDDYALDAFAVEAIDYLVKPIRREDLQRALQRAATRLQLRPLAENPSAESLTTVNGTGRSHLSARTHHGLELIPVESVMYFLADQKYVNAVHEAGSTLIDDSLKQLEDEFGDRFVRVHRSALVARDRMVRLETQPEGGQRIFLRGYPEGIRVSRRHLADVRRLMKSL